MTFAANDIMPSILAPGVTMTNDRTLSCEFYPENPNFEQLSNFVCTFSPSKVTGEQCDWISISRGNHADAPTCDINAVEGMKTAFATLARGHRQDGNITLTVASLDELARTYGVTKGKWMMFCTTEEVDALWERIVRFVCLEEGGGDEGCRYARVSPNKGDDQHVVSVYVDDFGRNEEVMRVREALRGIGFERPIGFKMDAYTVLGIYRRNPWGISCNRYFE
ncbi:hypothetical protein V5O48_003032 [Marasmius crinis-equi]|uniref:DUF1917-domain-containing protein n=1 Tax=Marasmius crinis-equi TaxID=585013 RepID=A0ABR3FUQ3_9AGAR